MGHWGRAEGKRGVNRRVLVCTVPATLSTSPSVSCVCLGWFAGVLMVFLFFPLPDQGLPTPINVSCKRRRNVQAPDMWSSCPSSRLCGCRSAAGRAAASRHPGVTGDRRLPNHRGVNRAAPVSPAAGR